MKIEKFLWLLAILLIFSLSSSQAAEDYHFPPERVEKSDRILLIDATGEEISLSAYPKRIISLAPSITECLFSLNLDEEIVGVTIYCDYPQPAKGKERVGSLLTFDVERIFSLKPDLILATKEGNQEREILRLRKLGLKIFVLDLVERIDHIYRDLYILGRLTNRGEEAAEVVRKMQLLVQEIEDKAGQARERPLCFWQLGVNPLITVGQATLADHLLGLAGGENLAASERGYIPYNLEEVIARSPEVILMIGMGETLDSYRALWSKFPQLKAQKSGRIYSLNPDLVNRYSPRIVQGLRELAEALHPGALGRSGAGDREKAGAR
ncbi:MAG: ABC transporter substrate-binding protein [bacterium]